MRRAGGSGRIQARDHSRDPTLDRQRGLEQQQDLFRRQQRRRKQERVLVHIDDHVVRKPEERFHHPLVEECDGEPGILGLHQESAIELLELQSDLVLAEGLRDPANDVPRRDP